MSRTPYSINTYVGSANAAVLSGSITSTATTISISGTTTSWGTLGSTGGFAVAINYGTAIEEKVYIPSGSYAWGSGVITISGVQRGYDNTTAAGQSDGFSVVHVLTATDLQEANYVVNHALGLPGSNTAVGSGALSSNTSGVYNTALGVGALQSNTIESNNVAIGNNALLSNNGGSFNTAVGVDALLVNTSGSYNTAIGVEALVENTTGKYNVAIGNNALQQNTIETANTAVGYAALANNNGGQNNTAVGYNSLQLNTSGTYNTAVGSNALAANSTGQDNTAVGSFSLSDNSTGTQNTVIGSNALTLNTTGNYNTAIGSSALNNNTTGSSNVSIGQNSSQQNTSGNGNVAIGSDALLNNKVGFNNIAVGTSALMNVISGYGNTAVGIGSLNGNEGTYNTTLGYGAAIVGSGNVAIGVDHTGATVTASGLDKIVLGSSLHNTTIPGTLTVSGTVSLSTPLGIIDGGTGSTTASGALTNLGAVALSTVTTAGDLIVGSGAGAVSRLGIGANGDVLTVVSGSLDYAPPATVTPATTVTGPDAFGAAAVVGTGTEYARVDHNHGLPAAPSPTLTYDSNVLASATQPGLTASAFLTTASLAAGTWLLTFSCVIDMNSTTNNVITVELAQGTALASFSGPSGSLLWVETTTLNNDYFSMSFTTIVTISSVGTLEYTGVVNVLGPQLQATPYTGYTAIKIG